MKKIRSILFKQPSSVKLKYLSFAIISLFFVVLIFLKTALATNENTSNAMSSELIHHLASNHNIRPINPKVLSLALKAYECASEHDQNQNPRLTIIDYSLPSTSKRLWVIDMNHQQVLFNTYVAHGSGSGLNYAHHFSNLPNSHSPSLGLFQTGNSYQGKYGLALRLKGLESGFNDEALKRAVVIHSAWYVGAAFKNAHGYMGRSWGCPALSKKIYKPIIHEIQHGSLIFAYYPDKHWLNQSKYLHCKA